MGVHVIIDGYNMILAGNSRPGDLEKAREDLAGLLTMYKKAKAHSVTLVFDAQYANSPGERGGRLKGIPVVYSPAGVTADSVIAQMARKLGAKAVVVSSDRGLQDRVKAAGAAFIDTADFGRKLDEALYESMGKSSALDEKEPFKSTEKKGPARRLTKARRNLLKKRDKL